MNKKIVLFMIIAVLMGVALTACERPASTAPAATATGGGIPFPVIQPTTSLGELATQTAIAKNQEPTTAGGQPVENPTPVPADQATPVPPADATSQPPAPESPTATPHTQIVVPTATPGRPSSYTIQPGDHYICIARRYNLNLGDFLAVNGLSMNSLAVSGVTVKIPQSGTWNSANGSRSLKGHPDTYVVQPGDTLNKVACAYGDVDPNAIIAANALKSPYTLSTGQKLNIP
jgi:LysM repeat protein